MQVFQKVGMEALLLAVPFVCKSWYQATLNPKCWQHLIFPENFFAFVDRVKEYQKEVPITSFIKSMVNRNNRCATTLMLPHYSTEEELEYAAKQQVTYNFLSKENNNAYLIKIFYQKKIRELIWEHFQKHFSKDSFG